MLRTLLLLLLAGSVQAQLPQALATDTHPNAPYRIYAFAYSHCDSTLVDDAYSPDAYYLESSEHSKAYKGRDAIEKTAGFLNRTKAKGCGRKIEFALQNRIQTETLIHDVGYYHSQLTDEKGDLRHFYGQFFTVLTKQPNGTWRFHFDTDIRLSTSQEFEKCKALE